MIPQITLCVNTLCSYSATKLPSVRASSRSKATMLTGRLPAWTLWRARSSTRSGASLRAASSARRLLQRVAESERLGLRQAIGDGELGLRGIAAGRLRRQQEIERSARRALVQHLEEGMLGVVAGLAPDHRRGANADAAAPARFTDLPLLSMSSCCR